MYWTTVTGHRSEQSGHPVTRPSAGRVYRDVWTTVTSFGKSQRRSVVFGKVPYLRAVRARRLEKRELHRSAVFPFLHIDKVDHHEPADITQPQLRRHLNRRGDVHRHRDGFHGAFQPKSRSSRVDVNRGERFGLLNHEVRAWKVLVLEPHPLLRRPTDGFTEPEFVPNLGNRAGVGVHRGENQLHARDALRGACVICFTKKVSQSVGTRDGRPP